MPGRGCPALFTLSVIGRVELDPGRSTRRRDREAFNAHQRRGGRRPRLLGPDAVDGRGRKRSPGTGCADVCGPARGGSGPRPSPTWLASGSDGWLDAAVRAAAGTGRAGARTYAAPAAADGRAGWVVVVHHATCWPAAMTGPPA